MISTVTQLKTTGVTEAVPSALANNDSFSVAWESSGNTATTATGTGTTGTGRHHHHKRHP